MAWRQTKTVTVSSGQTTSEAIHGGEFERGSVQLPSAITGTTLNFDVSNDGTTWDSVRDDSGAAVANQTVAADQVHNVHPNCFKSRYFRLVMASQGADRSIIVNVGGN